MNKPCYWNAILLALIFGVIGIQEFYVNHTVRGILSILFFWTWIPALVALIQIGVWLYKGEDYFIKKYNY